MTPLDYGFISKCLKERSGLVLSADKHYLVESRLLPVARQAGFAHVGDLVLALKNARDSALMASVIEAMAVKESFFFRDKTPFEHFRQTIMPALLAARRQSRTIRIWCAAASTGQEPYSLAICLREMEASLAGWNIEILATDISEDAMDRARLGIYTQFEVQRGLPIRLLIKHFTQTGERWRIDPELRAMVRCQQLNLLDDFSSLGIFDVIFCRNALIYFDRETKGDVLDRLAKASSRDGFLVLGAAETIAGLTDRFRIVTDKRGLYAPNRIGPRLPERAGANGGLRLVAINGSR